MDHHEVAKVKGHDCTFLANRPTELIFIALREHAGFLGGNSVKPITPELYSQARGQVLVQRDPGWAMQPTGHRRHEYQANVRSCFDSEPHLFLRGYRGSRQGR